MTEKRQSGAVFLDGCHRWGFIIGPILTLVGAALMFSHFVGVMEQDVKALHEQNEMIRAEMRDGFSNVSTRITRNESIIDSLGRQINH